MCVIFRAENDGVVGFSLSPILLSPREQYSGQSWLCTVSYMTYMKMWLFHVYIIVFLFSGYHVSNLIKKLAENIFLRGGHVGRKGV